MRAWMRYLEEVPTSAVRVPSFNMALLPRFSGKSEADFMENEAAVRPIRKHFYERMGTKGFGDRDFRIKPDTGEIEAAKANGVDPQAYIADVIAKIAGDWPTSRWDELMPWNWMPPADQPVAQAA